jgi:hypothetical protein
MLGSHFAELGLISATRRIYSRLSISHAAPADTLFKITHAKARDSRTGPFEFEAAEYRLSLINT